MEFNIFEALPEELSEHVFLFFSPRELEHCATVCRFFEQITSSDELWKRICVKRWGVATYAEWDNITSFKLMYRFLDKHDFFLGIWRTTSGGPEGGVLLVSLEKGRLEGKVLLVLPSGEVHFPPVFRVTPAPALQFSSSKMRVFMCPTYPPLHPHNTETRGRAQSGTEWREGHLMYDPDTSSIGAYSSGAWSSRYERAPLMAMMTRDHVHAHHQDHPHDYQDHHDDHIQQQQLEHGALALQGLWASKYGGHGWEVMSVCLNDSTLSALKMIGDPNVPSGELSWDADVAELGGVDVRAKPPAQILQCAGRGQISPVGFTSPRWVPGTLKVQSVSSLTFHWAVLNSQNVYTRIDTSTVLNIPDKYIFRQS